MTANSSKKSGQQAKKSAEGNDYPNIIEEPIRVVGDRPRDKSKAGKSQNKTQKRSGKK
jgi:hypothetical protein